MSIVPIEKPMTSALSHEIVQTLAQTYDFVKCDTLTTTAFGRPLDVLTIGSGERKVLYTAAHHANEWITSTLLLKFAEDLCTAIAENGKLFGVSAATIARLDTIYILPMVDPDGVDLVTGAIQPGSIEYVTAQTISDEYPDIPFPNGWKANLLGVDLNLQYPAGWLQAREIKFSQGYTRPSPRDYVGRAPLNQKETIALAEFTRDIEPELILAYHTQGQVIYWQFQNYQVPGAQTLAEEFARLSGYQLSETPYNSSFAGYKDWFIQDFRKPGFTIEAGYGESPVPLSQFPEIYQNNLGILVTAALGLPE